ncbi:unnamed protein product [Protopolystoma xenopodis]|uniref:Uncharacterized protein n=1 Tax=Protopolystoma xenopodis TaxID=117903 RepID=A0A448WGN3_9PLAT|nr:unnamed protein product [Protopolystoma xenopodis]
MSPSPREADSGGETDKLEMEDGGVKERSKREREKMMPILRRQTQNHHRPDKAEIRLCILPRPQSGRLQIHTHTHNCTHANVFAIRPDLAGRRASGRRTHAHRNACSNTTLRPSFRQLFQ